jgi:hypothetical protein
MTAPVTPPEFPLTALMKSSTWLFPLVETAHIWGFVILVGSVAMFDLRVLGMAKTISVRALSKFLLPFSLGAVLIVVPTGVLLFVTQPMELLANRVFMLKLGLIFLAACNALAFHAGPYRSVADWDVNTTAPLTARLMTAASIVIWLSVILCGRMLAYV